MGVRTYKSEWFSSIHLQLVDFCQLDFSSSKRYVSFQSLSEDNLSILMPNNACFEEFLTVLHWGYWHFIAETLFSVTAGQVRWAQAILHLFRCHWNWSRSMPIFNYVETLECFVQESFHWQQMIKCHNVLKVKIQSSMIIHPGVFIISHLLRVVSSTYCFFTIPMKYIIYSI